MTLGIPDRNYFAIPKSATNETWTCNIQMHNAQRAGLHYDLRLNPPSSTEALSWALRSLPNPGEKQLAKEQPTHHESYMGWQGTLSNGYGAGQVQSIFHDKVDVLKSEPNKINFNIYEGAATTRYSLMRMNDKDWILYNYTATIQNKNIPNYKSHYKSIPLPKVLTTVPNEIWAPKIDGAHNTILLRPNKRIDVYSYRTSKKGDTRIDHSYRTDLYKQTSPPQLGDTTLRAELYIPGQTSSNIGGVLNSNVWKSRQTQKEIGKLTPMVFDVIKYKGKNVENLPYKEKIPILKEVVDAIPELELPKFANTQQEKIKLLDEIRNSTNPHTKEGIVIYKLNEAVPYKSKKEDDYDVLITGTFPAIPGSKYDGNGIGGFLAKPENRQSTTIRIGSGLSDEIRRDAFNNPLKYIGHWAKVTGQSQYDASGKLRMPIFKELRYEKYN